MDHGGRLNAAVKRWGIPRKDWLDLSTGINPCPWPVPDIPVECWQRLPEVDDGLEPIARAWAGAPRAAGCLPVAGTQAAIQVLPALREPCRVAVPVPGYSEHADCWRRAGHQLVPYAPDNLDESLLASVDVLVCINPNNPTAACTDADSLRRWHRYLAARGGWLVVDEAFIEGTDVASLVPDTGGDGLIVLRSLGKFFGLAGARAGLLFGPETLCRDARVLLGPWALSAPARFIMQRALADHTWQAATAAALARESARLAELLTVHNLPVAGRALLFCYCPHPQAGALADALGRQGVLVREFAAPAALRFGLPGSFRQWQQLEVALEQVMPRQALTNP